MATKAHLEGNKRYLEKLDRVVFYVDKGQKDKIKAHAASQGKSLNAFINEAIEEKVAREKAAPEALSGPIEGRGE